MEITYRRFRHLDAALSNATQNEYCVAAVTSSNQTEIHFEYLLFRTFREFKVFRNEHFHLRFHEVLKIKNEVGSLGHNTGVGRLVFDLDLEEKLYGDRYVHPEFDADFEYLVQRVVEQYYPNAYAERLVFVWCSDIRAAKYSRHLVVKNALLGNFRFDLKNFYLLLLHEMKSDPNFYYVPHQYLKLSGSFVDPSIPHGSFFRMLETKKDNHEMRLNDPSFIFDDTLVRPFGHIPLMIEHHLQEMNAEGWNIILGFDQAPGEDDPNSLTDRQIIEIVKELSVERATNTRSWIMVGACLRQLSESNEVYLAWVEWSRQPAKYRSVTDLTYQGRWDNFTPRTWTSESLLRWFRKDSPEEFDKFMEHYPQVKLSWKYKPYDYELPRHYRVIVDRYTEDRIKPFDESKSIEVVRSRMDTFKTRSLIEYIKEHKDLKWILYPTSRISTAQDVRTKFAETGRPIVFYSEIDGKPIAPESIIVIQLESLGKLFNKQKHGLIGNSDLLILDECTSLCKQLSSTTMNSRFSVVSKILTIYIQSATKVIALDADIDDRIVDLLLEMRTEPIHVQWNLKTRSECSVEMIYQEEKMLKDIVTKLDEGENIFIVCSTKAKAHLVQKYLLERDVNVRCHTSKEAPLDREALTIVNDVWLRYCAVIITSTVANGVDFHQEHFDSMFIFGENGETAPVRDIKQMTGRVRKLRKKKIFSNLRIKHYKCPTSYQAIRSNILYKTTSFGKAVNKTNNRTEPAIESLMKEYDANGINIVDDRLVILPEKDVWYGKIHIRNIQEDNRSKRHFKEEFERMITEQGMTITYVDELLPEEELDKIKAELDELKVKMKEEELAIRDQTELVTPREAAAIQKRIETSIHTQEDEQKMEVYSVGRCFIERPSNEDHDYFKQHRTVLMNILAEKEATEDEVLAVDMRSSSHPLNIQSRLDQFHLMKELVPLLKQPPFEKNADISTTDEMVMFDTFAFQDHGQPDKIDIHWKDWLTRAQMAFGYGNPKITLTTMPDKFKDIMKKWSGIQFIRSGRKERRIGGARHTSTIYKTSLPSTTNRILPLLKSWRQIAGISSMNKPDNPRDDSGVVVVIEEAVTEAPIVIIDENMPDDSSSKKPTLPKNPHNHLAEL